MTRTPSAANSRHKRHERSVLCWKATSVGRTRDLHCSGRFLRLTPARGVTVSLRLTATKSPVSLHRSLATSPTNRGCERPLPCNPLGTADATPPRRKAITSPSRRALLWARRYLFLLAPGFQPGAAEGEQAERAGPGRGRREGGAASPFLADLDPLVGDEGPGERPRDR